jgi:hypothetical protein
MCRTAVQSLHLLPVPVQIVAKPRIPFVQKQMWLRDILLTTQKVMVISRFGRVLESLARTWTAHETFYGIGEWPHFACAPRAIWCAPLEVLYSNLDITTLVDTVVLLEPYPKEHSISFLVHRMFSFALVKPRFVMLRLDGGLDDVVPPEASEAELLALLQ